MNQANLKTSPICDSCQTRPAEIYTGYGRNQRHLCLLCRGPFEDGELNKVFHSETAKVKILTLARKAVDAWDFWDTDLGTTPPAAWIRAMKELSETFEKIEKMP